MRIALNVVGIFGLFVGFVWFFQGIGVLPGSFMTGQTRWAVYGGFVVLASLILLTRARRRPKD